MSETNPPKITAEELETVKQAQTTVDIPNLILKRWSPRAFSEETIPAGDLKKLFVAASWAASSYNEQPWRFLLGRRGDETWKKIFSALGEFNQVWAKAAPVLVLSAGKKTFTQNGAPNGYALHDTGAATAYLGIAATALGLHTHSMGGFDKELARASFGIPSDYEVGSVTAVGYLGDPSTLSADLQKTEIAPRSRKTPAEFVFSGWDKPASF